MRWPSFPQTTETGIGRRQILRSGATALAVLGTTTPVAGRVDSAPASGESGVDDLAPSTTDWSQQQKLTVDDGTDFDFFGNSVAVSNDGTTALIGASSLTSEGSAYVFTSSNGEWSQQQKLTPDDGNEQNLFGESVALSNDGTTALIGTSGDDTENGTRSGSVYVFTRTDDVWTQRQKITPADGDNEDGFGISVALSSDGTTALIGAWGDDPNGIISGSAYVFTRTDDGWTQQQKIVPADGDQGKRFGRNVGLSSDGTTAIIGSHKLDQSVDSGPGAAYVFTSTNGSWSQQQKLIADDGDDADSFGHKVTLSSDGTTALIGAIGDDTPNGENAGSAYVFTDTNGAWSQQQKLTPDDGNQSGLFGSSVVLSNDGATALIGSSGSDNSNGQGAGSVYMFTDTDGTWSQQQKLVADDGDRFDAFGQSVALSGDNTTVFVGANGDDDQDRPDVGSAYVFTESDDDDESDDGDSTLRRFDTNDNGQIDFGEVVDAIAAHNNGTQIGGEPVDFGDVLAVIEAHNTGTQV